MKHLLTAIVIVLGVIFVWGLAFGDGRDHLRVTAISEKKLVTVVVTMPDADERYYWLKVFGCSAEVTDHGVQCNGSWDASSEREPGQRKQHLIPFRDCPSHGTVQFTALVFDRFGIVLASGQHTILRSF